VKQETRMTNPARGKFAAKSLAAAAAVSLPFLAFATPASADNGSTWDQLAECESGGNWSIDTGNGYKGGLQFSQSTWEAFGGSGNPANASKSEQIRVAENVQEGQGWGAWPACSAKLGLSGAPQGGSSGGQEQAQQETQQQQQAPAQEQQAPAEPQQQEAPAEQQPVQEQPVQEQPVQQAAPQPAQTSGETYTVAAGDTLSKIAQQQGVAGGWQSLYEANADKIADPVLIYPGQVLVLP